jgi:hypothetical protein
MGMALALLWRFYISPFALPLPESKQVGREGGREGEREGGRR